MFVLIGIAAYVLAMIATLPASLAIKNRIWRTGIAGTLWNGEVGIVGGSRFEWHWAPLRSLTSLGFAADWTATGPDTDLGGRVLAGLSSTVLDKVSGSSHATLLQALQPNLPFTCDLVMQMEFDRIATGGSDQGIDGRMTTDAGTCTAKGGGAPVAVPPLLLTAEKIGTVTQLRLTPRTQRRKLLMDATLSEDGKLTIRMTPDGARTLPFAGLPAGGSIAGEL